MKIENSNYVIWRFTHVDVQLLVVFRVISRSLVRNMLGLLRVDRDRGEDEAGCYKASADASRSAVRFIFVAPGLARD